MKSFNSTHSSTDFNSNSICLGFFHFQFTKLFINSISIQNWCYVRMNNFWYLVYAVLLYMSTFVEYFFLSLQVHIFIILLLFTSVNFSATGAFVQIKSWCFLVDSHNKLAQSVARCCVVCWHVSWPTRSLDILLLAPSVCLAHRLWLSSHHGHCWAHWCETGNRVGFRTHQGS